MVWACLIEVDMNSVLHDDSLGKNTIFYEIHFQIMENHVPVNGQLSIFFKQLI